ncbi:MAG: hydro-lyase, Fe-S type, tartrate/fumarate subfamily, alpha subunit [Firmicutes bacterium]|nr:hydro-lyase, Fe-S type, tartrate/fumarate subfamily, alpha subunit [Bacillota bacterium]
MRSIDAATITQAVAKLAIDANYYLSEDIYAALVAAQNKEESPLGREIIGQLVKNAGIAREEAMPICQDTGLAVVFVELGQEVHIQGGSLEEAIHAGVAQGYVEGYLRKSAVADPLFNRTNTQNNTPAIIHYSIVPGDQLKIVLAPKGAGSENKSAVKMLVPADGIAGVKKFILDTVTAAGPNSCPPMVIGIGIGGTMEKAAILAKKALVRPVDRRNEHPEYAKLEEEVLAMINQTGIGPQGLGGRVTALAVNIEWYPTHIAGLPVAVNINCHAARHAQVEL